MKRLAMLAAGGLIALLPNIASARSHFFLGFNVSVPLFGFARPHYYGPAYSYAPVYSPPVYYAAPAVAYVAPQPTYCPPPVTYYSAPQTYYVAPPVAVYQYSGPSVYFNYGSYGHYWDHQHYYGGGYYHYGR